MTQIAEVAAMRGLGAGIESSERDEFAALEHDLAVDNHCVDRLGSRRVDEVARYPRASRQLEAVFVDRRAPRARTGSPCRNRPKSFDQLQWPEPRQTLAPRRQSSACRPRNK